ncbi:MAG: nucleotidyltransferase domain-containing protein [Chloroflexi bacterium]|nr:nucleotidyltransferase domain-containing protein [Chloroflexota bacterium]
MATYPTEVSSLLDDLLAGVRAALGDNFLGFYLRGSLALGGFDPEASDVDILIVTERGVSDPEFEALARLHRRISPDDNEYGLRYDVSYIDRDSIRRFEPGQRRHPSGGGGLPFDRWDHRSNWVLER